MPNVGGELSHPGLLGRVLGWVRVYVDTGSDLSTLSREELRRISADLALAEWDLTSLSMGARDNTLLMERMMRAHGIDREDVMYGQATLLRDMERVCTLCAHTRRCRRELNAGTAMRHCNEYCPNAATFEDLRISDALGADQATIDIDAKCD